MPRINLLPWREKERRERKNSFLVMLGGALVGGLLASGAFYLIMTSMIDAQQQRNNRLRAEIQNLDRQIQEINNLETQKQRFISRMQVIDKLQRSRSEIVHLFDEVTNIMPDGVYLTSMKQANRHLKFSGVAQSSTRVSTLMRSLAASQWLRDPELELVENKTGANKGNSFIVDATQISSTPDEPVGKAASAARLRRTGGPAK
jgi:type IV pilus assembly protein PilN